MTIGVSSHHEGVKSEVYMHCSYIKMEHKLNQRFLHFSSKWVLEILTMLSLSVYFSNHLLKTKHRLTLFSYLACPLVRYFDSPTTCYS